MPSDNPFEDVLGTLSSFNDKGVAVLAPMNSKDVDINRVINDHIYGLLCLDELDENQIDVLKALLRTKGY